MNDIKFLHFRRPAITLGQQGMRIERAGSFGGVTVAYRDLGNDTYRIGIGRCRTNERYTRKLGRDAALNAFEQFNHVITTQDFMNEIAELLARGPAHKNLRAQISTTGKGFQ